MIPIVRGPEPPELIKVRRRQLARATLARHHAQDIDFQGYAVVKEALWRAQGMKCAYCERHQGLEAQPVEHFRPKNGVARDIDRPRLLDKDYYWWLAWSWENLLFSCVSCNSAGRKGNKFPLAGGSSPLHRPPAGLVAELPVACFDLASERPLLLDPGRDDPLDHIVWRPENPMAAREEDLLWRPFHRTDRGRVTIEILGLRGEIVDQVNDHIRSRVLGRLHSLWREVQRENLTNVQADWSRLCSDLFSPYAPFQAASFDALCFLVPLYNRQQWRLAALERPWRKIPAAAQPCPGATDPPALAGLPDEIRLQVRAGQMDRDSLLRLLCIHREWTLDELAVVMELAPATVEESLRGMTRTGVLERIDGRYRLCTP